jgi:hypothetical protein
MCHAGHGLSYWQLVMRMSALVGRGNSIKLITTFPVENLETRLSWFLDLTDLEGSNLFLER